MFVRVIATVIVTITYFAFKNTLFIGASKKFHPTPANQIRLSTIGFVWAITTVVVSVAYPLLINTTLSVFALKGSRVLAFPTIHLITAILTVIWTTTPPPLRYTVSIITTKVIDALCNTYTLSNTVRWRQIMNITIATSPVCRHWQPVLGALTNDVCTVWWTNSTVDNSWKEQTLYI